MGERERVYEGEIPSTDSKNALAQDSMISTGLTALFDRVGSMKLNSTTSNNKNVFSQVCMSLTVIGVALSTTPTAYAKIVFDGPNLTDAALTGETREVAVLGASDVLAPGDTLTFTGTYTITQTDVETP